MDYAAAGARGELNDAQYTEQLQQVTRDTIERQLKLGIDVLVHGEAERNDMVEYFGEQLAGVGFSKMAGCKAMAHVVLSHP